MKRKIRQPHDTIIIGIAGAKRGVGVTHICILLAEYLSIENGAKVALLEWNDHGDFAWIESSLHGEGSQMFSHKGVDYFGRAETRETEKNFLKGYSYIIFDFGELKMGYRKELNLCHTKVLVGNMAIWKRDKFFQIVKSTLKENISWCYLLNLTEEEQVKKEKRKYGVSFFTLEYSPIERKPSKNIRNLLEIIRKA